MEAVSLLTAESQQGDELAEKIAALAERLHFRVYPQMGFDLRNFINNTTACKLQIVDLSMDCDSLPFDQVMPIPSTHTILVSRTYTPINFRPLFGPVFDSSTGVQIRPFPEYNGRISAGLVNHGWKCEHRVIDELGLKCDFEKNGIWLEVEFGNARSYYQDYIKFMMAKKYRDAKLGLLLCPTNSFASLLCELGRQRAHENAVRERPAVYSGMMSFEKAARELPYLGFMFDMPILVAGVGVKG